MAKTTTLQDRVMIDQLATAGASDRQIASHLGWTIATVRKWRRLARHQGRQGLWPPLGRPKTGALSTYPPEVPQTLRTLRTAHPGWGPKTLRAELAAEAPPPGPPLPSRASIARWLKHGGLARAYQRHQALPPATTGPAQAPHQRWEMDARGYQWVPEVGVIALLNINDVYSKVKVLSYPCYLGERRARRHPTTEDYQVALRLAFTQWGLPDQLAVDHDSVFYDNISKSPFPTRLHLWLMGLGVELAFARMHRPTDQAIVERAHQTWYHQVLEGQRFPTWTSLHEALACRQGFLNERLPCASLGEVPPLRAHPAARQPRRLYRPEYEAQLLDLSRVYTYLSQGRWFRKVSSAGTVALGGQVYSVTRAWAGRDVEITFDPRDHHFLVQAPDGKESKSIPIQGITATALMGEAGSLVHLNPFQLALPFSWDQWRVIRLCETFRVMT